MTQAIDISAFDPEIRVQDDLFRHTNGAWLTTIQIPSDQSRFGSFDLLREEGEVIVDEVRHHWVAYIKPAIEGVLAVVLLVASPFVNVNVAAFDAYKQGTAVPVVADARKTLVELTRALGGYRVGADLAETVEAEKQRWDATVDAAFAERHLPLPSQNEIIGAVNEAMDDRDVVVCAAGSAPAARSQRPIPFSISSFGRRVSP